MKSYSIQEPCTEDWGKMTTEEQGRHCQVCCKTVVDFSKKSNTEIVDFLKANKEQKVCGRFRMEQLQTRSSERPSRSSSRYRTFFAALVFVFGGLLFSSCSQNSPEHLMGAVAYIPDSVELKTVDTTKILVPDSTKKTGSIRTPKCPETKCEEGEKFLMGDVAFEPGIDSLK